MKKNRLLIFLMVILLICTPVFSALADANAADKSVTANQGNSRKYRVTVTVPGEDKENRHDEILIMVDGSYSLDKEWPYARDGILEIGSMVLNGKNNVRLTLMAFGMGPNVVAEHIETMEQLEALLDTYQGNLLYGRSSTNIEGAFIGIQRYLATHDDSMKDAIVVFMTDGGVNQYAYPNKWLTEVVAKYKNHSNLAVALFYELANVHAGEATLSPYTKSVFTEEEIEAMMNAVPEENLTAIQKIMEEPYDETITKGKKWLETVFQSAYAYNNMSDENGGYSICDMERAILDYQASINAYIENAFYYIAGSGNISGGETNNQKRAIDAANELATNEEYHLKNMYLVQYANDGRAEWMQFKTGTTQYKEMPANVEYVNAGAISNLVETIRKMLSDISLTPYNNVAIVDYMSKWVELLPETIRILDKDDQVVAEYDEEASDPANDAFQYKWLVDPPLCDELPPVVVENVPESEYELGGEDVIGNASGGIKKITWNIKQGPLLRIDHYRMEYDILVDINEPGFEYATSYPTNGNTYVNYTDENNLFQSNQIPVPKVKILLPKPPAPAPVPTPVPTPPPAEIPETGDTAHPAFWLAAMILTGAALVLALRRKNEKN